MHRKQEKEQGSIDGPRLSRRLAALAVAVAAAALVAAGCGSSSSSSSGSSTGSSAGGGTSSTPAASGSGAEETGPLAYLNAPEGATSVEAKPGPEVTTPVTKQKVRLNWGDTYPVPDGPIGDPKKTYTFCFSQGLVNNPWPTAQRESVMLEAARHPNLKMLYFNTNDANQQVQDLQSCQNKKVNALLVWPQTVGPLTPEINKLCKAGALVIGMERTVATRCYTSWLFLDYPGAVTATAEAVAKDLGGKGVVVESQGTPGSSPQLLRHKYFADVLAKYPGIKLEQTAPTDFGATTAYNVALDFLHSPKGKKIDAWYSHYEEEAKGIQAALKQVKRTGVKIYTIGGTRQSICRVQQGAWTYLQPGSATPLHGDLAVRLAIMKVEGKEIPKDLNLVSPPAITAANAKEAYVSEGWGPGCAI